MVRRGSSLSPRAPRGAGPSSRRRTSSRERASTSSSEATTRLASFQRPATSARDRRFCALGDRHGPASKPSAGGRAGSPKPASTSTGARLPGPPPSLEGRSRVVGPPGPGALSHGRRAPRPPSRPSLMMPTRSASWSASSKVLAWVRNTRRALVLEPPHLLPQRHGRDTGSRPVRGPRRGKRDARLVDQRPSPGSRRRRIPPRVGPDAPVPGLDEAHALPNQLRAALRQPWSGAIPVQLRLELESASVAGHQRGPGRPS